MQSGVHSSPTTVKPLLVVRSELFRVTFRAHIQMPSLAFPAKNCGAKYAANTLRNVNELRRKRFQKYRGTRPSEREMAPVFRRRLDSVYVRRCCCLRFDLNQTLNLYPLLGQRLFLPIFFDLHYILRSLFVFASIRIRHLEKECPKITPRST